MKQAELLPTEKKPNWIGMVITALVLTVVVSSFLELASSKDEEFGWLRKDYPTLSDEAFNEFWELCKDTGLTTKEAKASLFHIIEKGIAFLNENEKSELIELGVKVKSYLSADDLDFVMGMVEHPDSLEEEKFIKLTNLLGDARKKLPEADRRRLEELTSKALELGLIPPTSTTPE